MYSKAYYERNRDKILKRNADYREKNKEKIREINRKYAETHKEQISLKNKRYAEKNSDKIKARCIKNKAKYAKTKRDYYRKRRKEDPIFHLHYIMSNLILTSLKTGTKTKKTEELLGYSIQELKEHLEKQFEPWMTWENHGLTATQPCQTWHIDHIIPINTFHIEEPGDAEFTKCWSLENLRPLDSFYNVRRPKNGSDILGI